MTDWKRLRKLSRAIFGRDHQLEISLAVAGRGEAFNVDELISEIQQNALEVEAEPPGRSSVRTCLARLEEMLAVRRVSAPRKGESHIWVAIEGAGYWAWLAEIAATFDCRVGSR